MEENNIQVWFYCDSEKDSSACCAYAYGIPESTLSDEDLYDSFLYNADYLWEAFAEMAPEFGSGIDKAELLVENGTFTSLREAIKEVFGHFLIACEVDGVRKELNWNIDNLMYSMIFEEFGVKS